MPLTLKFSLFIELENIDARLLSSQMTSRNKEGGVRHPLAPADLKFRLAPRHGACTNAPLSRISADPRLHKFGARSDWQLCFGRSGRGFRPQTSLFKPERRGLCERGRASVSSARWQAANRCKKYAHCHVRRFVECTDKPLHHKMAAVFLSQGCWYFGARFCAKYRLEHSSFKNHCYTLTTVVW